MKIDVQGYELNVLIGARQTIEKYIKYIYVELSFVHFYQGQPLVDDVVSLLKEYGFGLVGIFNPQIGDANELQQADFLFCRDA